MIKRLVIAEARKLKKLITPEEINRLDPYKLDGKSNSKCIYGLITGSCKSERAKELIDACTTKVFVTKAGFKCAVLDSELGDRPEIAFADERVYFYVSPIEKLTYKSPENGVRILNYLKGITHKLILI
jgi:hypothetical protein